MGINTDIPPCRYAPATLVAPAEEIRLRELAIKELEIKLTAEREKRQADKEKLQAHLSDEKEKRKLEHDK